MIEETHVLRMPPSSEPVATGRQERFGRDRRSPDDRDRAAKRVIADTCEWPMAKKESAGVVEHEPALVDRAEAGSSSVLMVGVPRC